MSQSWIQPLRIEYSFFTDNLPQLDVIDQDDSILIRATLPGVKKEDLEVSTMSLFVAQPMKSMKKRETIIAGKLKVVTF